jgi:predicted O-methyltransferase YrrM
VLPGLEAPYDLIFSDGDPEEMRLDLEQFLRQRLLGDGQLLTAIVPG